MYCNIDKKQIQIRKNIGYALFALTIFYNLFVLIFTNRQVYFYILNLPLLFAVILSYLQVVKKFCVAFAAVGISSLDALKKEEVKAYRIFAIKLAAQALLISIILSVIVGMVLMR